MYQEENKESQGGHGSCPCARSIPFRLLRSGSAWLGDSHAQTPCRLFSWKLNWIVTLCEHQAAGSKLSYFPAWSGCSSLVPSWSLFNLQFSFISSSILASQSGFFSPRLSTRFHSLGTVARSLPVQAIPKLSQGGNSNRTQTLPCLSGACRLSPLGAERPQCFHRPVFLLRGLAALLIILWPRWNHWGLPRGSLSQRQCQCGCGFSPICQSLGLCFSPEKPGTLTNFYLNLADCPGLCILLSKLESGSLVTWEIATYSLESWGCSWTRTGKDHLFERDSCSKRIKWWRPLFSY